MPASSGGDHAHQLREVPQVDRGLARARPRLQRRRVDREPGDRSGQVHRDVTSSLTKARENAEVAATRPACARSAGATEVETSASNTYPQCTCTARGPRRAAVRRAPAGPQAPPRADRNGRMPVPRLQPACLMMLVVGLFEHRVCLSNGPDRIVSPSGATSCHLPDANPTGGLPAAAGGAEGSGGSPGGRRSEPAAPGVRGGGRAPLCGKIGRGWTEPQARHFASRCPDRRRPAGVGLVSSASPPAPRR